MPVSDSVFHGFQELDRPAGDGGIILPDDNRGKVFRRRQLAFGRRDMS